MNTSLLTQLLGARVESAELFSGRGNDAYLVRPADGKPLVVKRYVASYVPELSESSLRFEHEILRRLRADGLKVPALLWADFSRADGMYAGFEFIPGQHAVRGERLARSAGMTLAQLHRRSTLCSDLGQRAGFRRHTDLDWVAPPESAATWLRRLQGHRHGDVELPWQFIVEHLELTLGRLAKLGFGQHPAVLAHGDLNPRNLLFGSDTDEEPHLIDFDLLQWESPIFDLAMSAWMVLREPPEFAWRLDWLEPFLTAYLSLHPLDRSLFEALPAALSLFMLRLMLWRARRLVRDGDADCAASIAAAPSPARLGLLLDTGELERAMWRVVRGSNTR